MSDGGILRDLEVLDLSSGIAGPMAGMLLADHGARVTRVERPDGGYSLTGSAGHTGRQRRKDSVMRQSTDRRVARPVRPAAAAVSKMVSRAWSLPPPRNFIAIERNLQVPTSDGTVLTAGKAAAHA